MFRVAGQPWYGQGCSIVVCHTFSVAACLAQGYLAFTGSGHVIDPATERKTLLNPTLMGKISSLIMLQPWHFVVPVLSPKCP